MSKLKFGNIRVSCAFFYEKLKFTISYGTVNKGKAEIYTFVWKCEHRIAVVDDKPLLQDVH